MQAALDLERIVHQALIDLYSTATAYQDLQFARFLEIHYLVGQLAEIQLLVDYVNTLEQTPTGFTPGIDEYLFDRYVLQP